MRKSDRFGALWLAVGVIGAVSAAGGCGGTSGGGLAGDDGGGDAGSSGGASSGSSGGGSGGSGGASGSSSGTASSGGSGGDASASDGGRDATTDAGSGGSSGGDGASDGPSSSDAAGADAASCAGPTPAPCVNPATGDNDFCSNGRACGACTDVTDDVSCTTAYGSASNPYLCLAGACTPGDCRSNADCAANPNGGLCGVTTPNACGKCTADSECAGTPATPVCNTTSGQCVSGTCTSGTGSAPGACPVNAMDVCCSGVCQPGPTGAGAVACCGTGVVANTYCTTTLGVAASCIGGACTACPAVTNGNYEVDPVNGTDATGTGATTPGCAFKTITRALQVIGPSPALTTTVTILGPSTVGAGETFPILIPANVTVTTADGAVTVAVPAKTSGFTLQAPASGVVGGSGAPLTIDGQSHAATFGIVATTGATAATTIGGVTVQNFLDAGILVERTAVLTIGPGVTSTGNGTTAARSDGLHVTGNANAVIMVAANQTPTHFDGNTDHGILVDTAGFITLTGSSTAASVTTNGNFAAGVWIAQTPGAPPQNVIDGLVSRGATNGNGLRFIAGSSVKLRNTISTGNQGSGVLVSSSAASSDISKIDLGDAAGDASAADYGHNTLQAPLGSGNNGNAGICLNVRANSGVLAAAGNNFASAACATAAGTVTINKNGCGNGACTGGTCDLGIAAGNGAGNDIDVSLCTHP